MKILTWESGQKVVRDATPEEEAELGPPTAEELDAIADSVADAMLENDARMKALGLVMADLTQAALGITQAEARAEVKRRFRNYYRGLL